MPTPVRLFPQLSDGAPTADADCGVSALRRAVAWASGDRLIWSPQLARHRMGKPTGPTNISDQMAAFRHPDTVAEFRHLGLQPPVIECIDAGSGTGLGAGDGERAARALQAGLLVNVQESYGVIRREMPSIAASATFDGNHSVSYCGFRMVGLTVHVDAGKVRYSQRYDSIADGRRPGIPKGPTWVPLWVALNAAAGLLFNEGRANEHPAGTGKLQGLIVHPALPIVVPPPPVPPTPPTPVPPPVVPPPADPFAAIRAAATAVQTAAIDVLMTRISDLIDTIPEAPKP